MVIYNKASIRKKLRCDQKANEVSKQKFMEINIINIIIQPVRQFQIILE